MYVSGRRGKARQGINRMCARQPSSVIQFHTDYMSLCHCCCCCSSSSTFDQKSATYDHLSVEPRHISIAAERTEELLRVLSRASNRHGNPITSFSFNHQQQGQWSQEMSPMKLPPEMMMLLHQFASLIPLTLRICHVILGVSLLTLSHSPSLSPSATLFVDVLLFLALHSGRG